MRIMLIILMITISGCAEKNINNRWVGAVNKLGIIANYPPREGISIGGIYLQMASEQCDNGYDKPGCEFSSLEIARLTDLLVNELIDDANKDIPLFRLKTFECQSTLGDRNSAIPSDTPTPASSTIGCYSEAKINDTVSYSFKRVGFPDYSFVKDSNAGLSAILPSSLASRFGLSFSDIQKQAVSVPNAVYYSISMPLFFEKLKLPASELQKKYIRTGKDSHDRMESFKAVDYDGRKIDILLPLKSGSVRNLTLTASQYCPTPYCRLKIIFPTEVYYSSVFNVTLYTNTELHGGVNSTLVEPTKLNQTPQYKPSITDNKMNNDPVLNASDGSTGAGVAATVNYVTQNSISLRNKYDALLAIGYRGVSYRVSPDLITPDSERFDPGPSIYPKPNFGGKAEIQPKFKWE